MAYLAVVGSKAVNGAQHLQRTSCQRIRGLRWCSLFPAT